MTLYWHIFTISLYYYAVSDYPATLVTTPNAQLKPQGNEEGQKYWHLFKHVDVDDPKISPLLSKKLVTEVFFPRILYTKVSSLYRGASLF